MGILAVALFEEGQLPPPTLIWRKNYYVVHAP
jgi:hypothetical protein